jgi:DNA-binding response OmpR family regulator
MSAADSTGGAIIYSGENRMKKWILIADDDSVICGGLSEALKDEGYETVTAENGEDALELLKARRFDLLLLDLKMPRINGFEVLKKLEDEKMAIKTVVLTGNLLGNSLSDEHYRILGLASNVMTKPFDMEELMLNIKSCLEQA